MSRAAWWRTAFLAVTGLAVAMELFAAWDGDPDTDPWTELIVRHVPAEVAAVAVGGLSLWLVVHFGRRYWRKRERSRDGGSG